MPGTTFELFPSTGFAVTHFLVSADTKKSLEFYSRIPGGKVVMGGENGTPCIVQLENTWITFSPPGTKKDQVLEVLSGVALKTMSNYLNHISPTELDPVFQVER